MLKQWGGPIAGWAPFDLGTAATFIANFMLLVLFFPLVYLTALFILGIFGMEKMVDHVAAQMSPSPERRRGGGTAGSIWNGIVSLTGIVLLFLVSLPLWLVPPLGPIAVLAILSWVNQRLLRYDAVSARGQGRNAPPLREHRGSTVWACCWPWRATSHFNLLAPVVFGLAFIRYLLGALIELRYESNPNKALAGGNALLN